MGLKVLVVNSEHPRLAEKKAEALRKGFLATLAAVFGVEWELCRFGDLGMGVGRADKHHGVMLSGCSTDWCEYPEDSLEGALVFLRNVGVPVLGICGGHQMLGLAYGAELGPMRELREGEEDPNPNYHPGMFKEAGFLRVRRLGDDELFEGLPEEMLVKQSHYFQVLDLPAGFELLATSDECRIQVMRKRGTKIYGVQFHPETHDGEHPDGKKVIGNFLMICGGGVVSSRDWQQG